MPIVTGYVPKALWGATAEQRPAAHPLTDVAETFVPKPRKPPKPKKRAFGDKQPGAAFRK